MDIIARYRAQIFVAGILIHPVTDDLPANPVVKLANLLFNFSFAHTVVFVNPFFQSIGSPAR